jgi:hypothetical protein
MIGLVSRLIRPVKRKVGDGAVVGLLSSGPVCSDMGCTQDEHTGEHGGRGRQTHANWCWTYSDRCKSQRTEVFFSKIPMGCIEPCADLRLQDALPEWAVGVQVHLKKRHIRTAPQFWLAQL